MALHTGLVMTGQGPGDHHVTGRSTVLVARPLTPVVSPTLRPPLGTGLTALGLVGLLLAVTGQTAGVTALQGVLAGQRTVILPKNDILQQHFRECRASITAPITKLRGLICSLGPNQSYKLLRLPIPATWGAVWHKTPSKMVIFAKITSFHHGGSSQLCPWPISGVPA